MTRPQANVYAVKAFSPHLELVELARAETTVLKGLTTVHPKPNASLLRATPLQDSSHASVTKVTLPRQASVKELFAFPTMSAQMDQTIVTRLLSIVLILNHRISSNASS